MVFVWDKNRKPLMPTTPKRARLLLDRGRARIYCFRPFTIILIDRTVEESELQPLELKLDPGSKVTGAALVRPVETETGEPELKVVGLFEQEHRGEQIKKKMEQRSNYRRRRRSANLRYRKKRFNNRRKPDGWLSPSIRHRVDSTANFVAKIMKLAPVTALIVETVRFDTQKMVNSGISGIEYQQGELAGFEVREYLLEKWGRKCAYCGSENVPLEVEHIIPRAKGGTDRVSNLALAS
jgi:5-methylcytosine-specific restriction endonuclease McrA